jgi:bifunctional ADP-heptose synthase (sugar kinase/adenylyltransferase)
MDTRAKILSLERARSVHAPRLVMVSGYFDLLRAEHVRELEEIRERTGAKTLLAAVLPWADAVLGQRARAEMVAALRMIDYVVAIDPSEFEALVSALAPAEVARLETSDALRNREFIEYVQRRHSA